MIGKLTKKDILALGYITILTAVAVGYGFSLIPSPVKEQVLAMDHKRVIDLGQLQASIADYYQTNNALPKTLDDLDANSYDPSNPLSKTDPQTNQPYEYTVTSPQDYSLCAVFTNDNYHESPNTYDATYSDYSAFSTQFKHPAGHFCFSKHVGSYQYPVPFHTHPMIPAGTAPTVYQNQPSLSPSPSQGY